MESMGWISILPVAFAIALALLTKDTVLSLTIACIVGCFIAGKGIWGFTDLLQSALGNTDFIWAALNILFFGVLVAYFEKSGAINGFTQFMSKRNLKRKGAQIMAGALGILCFADSMSPLFVGSVMRKIFDKLKLSREKLSYIADSTAAPVSVLYPFTGWSSYLTGLAIGIGCIKTREEAFSLMLKAIPFNFYAILSVLMVFLIALGVIKDYGAMRTAEEDSEREKLHLDREADEFIGKKEFKNRENTISIFINFIIPIVLLLVISIGSFIITGSVKVLEAAVIVVLLMSVSLLIQGMKLSDLSKTFTNGVKEAMPALLVLAVAYPLNELSSEMGTANFIVASTQNFLSPSILPCGIFVICAILAFATGTSWGTFAIAMPLVLPIAFNASGEQVSLLVVASFAAVAGGGVFGDHCSPLSDTTIMSSMGAGVDHISHVRTQLPYALTTGLITAIIYLAIGIIFA